MCGYDRDSTRGRYVSEKSLSLQIAVSLRFIDALRPEILAITPVGSFFDDTEFPPSVRRNLIEKLEVLEYVRAVQVESRPEYIIHRESQKDLELIQQSFGKKKLIVGIGLETASDFVRKFSVNKGFKTQDFVEACKVLDEHKILVKAYLLFKPPFLSESEALQDCVDSVYFASKNGADMIDVFLCRIYPYTLCDWLFRRKMYRAPWLWSAVELLRRLPANIAKKVSISTWGIPPYSENLPYNCPKCSERVNWYLQTWRLSRDLKLLEEMSEIDCECKTKWTMVMKAKHCSFQKSVKNQYKTIQEELHL